MADNALLRAKQGHGFAAERANYLVDVAKGKRPRLVGDDFAKAGPDRLVDGVEIQSKYCATPKATVDSCFSRNGKLIYQTRGRPMKVEVPKDQYPEVVRLMAKNLQTGDVTAAAARKQAKSIVVEGNIEYATARRIVEVGALTTSSSTSPMAPCRPALREACPWQLPTRGQCGTAPTRTPHYERHVSPG